MLYYASHANDNDGTNVGDVMINPELAKYVSNWGRDGDLGFMAVAEQPFGAVWARLFVGPNKGYSQVDDKTPELAIAVHPDYIGRGIGTQLMRHFLEKAKPIYPGIALNVRSDNPALRLYQRLGFEIVSEMINRVGGKSYDMRITF